MDQFSHNLSSASPDEAKSALRALFNAFPLAGHEDMSQVVGTYLIAIDGYCLVAIQRAVTKFIRGEVEGHDGRFLPTPAQISREVRLRQDAMTPPGPPRQALPAPVRPEPTDEERQRVADRVRQWVKDHTPDPVAAWKPREPGDIVRQMRAEGMKLSDAALATFTKDHLDRVAVPDPAEQFDAWEKARTTPPTPTEIPNTDRRVA